MALGDSYTEGCCANPIDSSFIDLLNQSASDYYILNFGFGSSNPVHYEKILSLYLEKIKPDLVLVNFYLGNDVLRADIKAPANIPQTFIIRDFSWISSTVPPFYQKEMGQTNFNSHIQAYDFYIKHFTLFHEDVNWFEQLLARSVLASRGYLAAKNGYAVLTWLLTGNKQGDDVERTRAILIRMNARCDTENINIHFSLIPSPEHVKKQTDIKAEFDELFQHLDSSNPITSDFTIADFDGEEISNHYINSGHLKHSLYLNKQLTLLLSETNHNTSETFKY
ncbi:MAG: SGNH/GDSL hydrolase family protein [Flavobacteriales bacterium]|nr:SGNH/GDSL hydrolase family protein [Flavobacteriales bacterium]